LDITVLLVADGIRGNGSGDIAAQTIVDVFKNYKFLEENLDEGLHTARVQADLLIHQKVAQNPNLEGMGTTATIAALYKNKVFWIHVGDSRLYLLRNKNLKQITRDHTFMQDFIDEGSLTPEQTEIHQLDLTKMRNFVYVNVVLKI